MSNEHTDLCLSVMSELKAIIHNATQQLESLQVKVGDELYFQDTLLGNLDNIVLASLAMETDQVARLILDKNYEAAIFILCKNVKNSYVLKAIKETAGMDLIINQIRQTFPRAFGGK